MDLIVICAIFLGIAFAGAALGFALVHQATERDKRMLALLEGADTTHQ